MRDDLGGIAQRLRGVATQPRPARSRGGPLPLRSPTPPTPCLHPFPPPFQIAALLRCKSLAMLREEQLEALVEAAEPVRRARVVCGGCMRMAMGMEHVAW